MRKCADCGAYFAESCRRIEYWGECHGRPIYESINCCPICDSTEHEEVDSLLISSGI